MLLTQLTQEFYKISERLYKDVNPNAGATDGQTTPDAWSENNGWDSAQPDEVIDAD